jgi:hypothetical protein
VGVVLLMPSHNPDDANKLHATAKDFFSGFVSGLGLWQGSITMDVTGKHLESGKT